MKKLVTIGVARRGVCWHMVQPGTIVEIRFYVSPSHVLEDDAVFMISRLSVTHEC
jgi:hypothetical protein